MWLKSQTAGEINSTGGIALLISALDDFFPQFAVMTAVGIVVVLGHHAEAVSADGNLFPRRQTEVMPQS